MIYTKYLRDEHGRIRGCLVKLESGEIGYSLCHPKDRHKTSKKLARQIAIGRAEKCNLRKAEDEDGNYYVKSRGNHVYVLNDMVSKEIRELLPAPA